MQSLYNCKRIDEDHYRVTKFDNGFVPFQDHEGRVSSYTCTLKDCECPQSHKPSCRHRKMLPFFIEEDHIDDNYFFCWDTHQWIKATGVFAEALEEIDDPLLSETNVEGSLFDPKTMEQLAKEGGHKPVSAAPSPQPSHYRRMR